MTLMKSKIFLFFSASLMPLLLSACSPVVRIEARRVRPVDGAT